MAFCVVFIVYQERITDSYLILTVASHVPRRHQLDLRRLLVGFVALDEQLLAEDVVVVRPVLERELVRTTQAVAVARWNYASFINTQLMKPRARGDLLRALF